MGLVLLHYNRYTETFRVKYGLQSTLALRHCGIVALWQLGLNRFSSHFELDAEIKTSSRETSEKHLPIAVRE